MCFPPDLSVCIIYLFVCREYLENIAVVDEGIKEFVNVVENYYGDDQKTAYVMSSDHGMTEWGKLYIQDCTH